MLMFKVMSWSSLITFILPFKLNHSAGKFFELTLSITSFAFLGGAKKSIFVVFLMSHEEKIISNNAIGKKIFL
jgi:hypothetical protein